MRRLTVLLSVVLGIAWFVSVVPPASAANSTCPGGTLNGVTVDNVTITGGSCTITNSVVNGRIAVQSGSLLLTTSTVRSGLVSTDATALDTRQGVINGNVSISGGPSGAHYTICGTNVGGNILVQNSDARVNVGDEEDNEDCPAGMVSSKVGGSISVTNVHDEIEINAEPSSRSEYAGALSVRNNSGEVEIQNNRFGTGQIDNNTNDVKLSDNSFKGTLTCSGNTFGVIGSGNTAAQKVGQCSGV